MKLLNKKAMTLFELLAVIIILGIVALIAFPTVNTLIKNSKQNAFAANATTFVQRARTEVTSDNPTQEDGTYTYYIGQAKDSDGSEIIEVNDSDNNIYTVDLTDDFSLKSTLSDKDVSGYVIIEFTGDSMTITYYYTDGENILSDTTGDIESFDDIEIDRKGIVATI